MKLQLRKITFRLFLLLPLLVFAVAVQAQSDPTGKSPATRTYAITNATIVQAPGKVMEGATIIFNNGLISSVGTNVSIPDNAEVIDGTDLFVYPGFIDGMSYTGAVQPKALPRPDNLFTPDPPNDYAGITPENHVIDQISVSENSINDMRKNGFTISHSVPYGRMLPGSGALITLIDAENRDDLVMYSDVSMFTQFLGAPGAYPGNTLGIMAKWRNLYRNAVNSKQHATMYASNAAGMPRPTRDRTLEAFYPVVSSDKPVFYNASSLLEAQRAMRLQKELGFALTLGNLKEGWDLAPIIKETGTKVFLSLDLPKEPKAAKEKDKTDEVKHLEDRRMEFYKKYVTQPVVMEKAGIKFGFSTMGTTGSKVKDNLLTLIEHGLSEDATLAALTINAAQLLNIDHITGTLDAGKLANAVISTGPIFNKESFIKYMFVDGDKYEYDKKEKKSSSAEGSKAIIGNWTYTVTSPEGVQTGTMTIRENGGALAGTISGMRGGPDSDMKNLTFMDGSMSFDFSFDAGGQSIEIVVVGTVTGNEYDAEASIAAFSISFPFTAIKDEGK